MSAPVAGTPPVPDGRPGLPVPDGRPGSPVVGLTGATGYVGGVVAAGLRAAGWRVVPLARSPRSDLPGARRLDLAAPVDPGALVGLDALVHAAWDLQASRPADAWRVNVGGSVRLLTAASATGIGRVLFVSSMSAYPGTRQTYGSTKLAVETVAAALGQGVVRLGLVYGPARGSGPGGMAGALVRMASLPVTPLVAGSARQFTVHEDDVRDAVPLLLGADGLPREPVGLAHPDPVAFRDVLRGLAPAGRCRFAPVPWRLVHGALRAGEALGVRLPFRSDSLLGLVRPAGSVPNGDVVAALGIRVRPFAP